MLTVFIILYVVVLLINIALSYAYEDEIYDLGIKFRKSKSGSDEEAAYWIAVTLGWPICVPIFAMIALGTTLKRAKDSCDERF